MSAEPVDPDADGLITTVTPFYRALRGLDRLYCRVWHRLEVHGHEHLPATGGAVLAANHASFLDILVIGAAVDRHVCFVARDTLAEWWWLRKVMEGCGAVLVRRGTIDRAALREMAAHLEAGDLVAIYPEGTRTRDGRLGQLKGGALMAARMAQVPVVPVGIRGAFEAWPRGQTLPAPGKVSVTFGPALGAEGEEALGRLEREMRKLIGEEDGIRGGA